MKRREFLARAIGGTCIAGSWLFGNPFRPRFRVARAAGGKILVVVFQRGGCDGLNTIVPFGDSDYYNLRSSIAIAEPDAGNPQAAIDLDGFFGMHPGLYSFEDLFNAGDLAILPTVHYPTASRSHFDGQELIEAAAVVPQPGLDGWLNRHLVSSPDTGQLRALSFTYGEDAELADSMRGQAIVSTFSDMTNFNLGLPAGEEAAYLQRMTQVYNQSPDPAKAHSQLVHDYGQALISDLSVVSSIDFNGYVPANGADYPTSPFGIQMKQTAQLIKEGVGLEVAALTRHGWDHHKNQGGGNTNGQQYRSFRDFSRGIAAFYHDLGADQPGSLMEDVTILTMTEFGRTARENASGGTDHGNAATWFVIGRSVTGGIYLGTGWPGLAPAQLNENRDLAHTVDYRDVYGEVITRHMGNNDLATVLPGHVYAPIGFLPA